ncbi:MAG: hypothetical protein ACI8X5_002425 [Planctomycetota bacterium]|jgi:hypothetical protein
MNQNTFLSCTLALAAFGGVASAQVHDLASDFSPLINDFANTWSYHQSPPSAGASFGSLLGQSGLIEIGSSEGLGMSNGWHSLTNCSTTVGTFWHTTVGKQGNSIIASPGWSCCQGGCQERCSIVFRAPAAGTVRVEFELLDVDTTVAGCWGVTDTTGWSLSWDRWAGTGAQPGLANGILEPGAQTGEFVFPAVEVHADDLYRLDLTIGSGCSWNDAVEVRWRMTYVDPPAEPFCFGDGMGNVCPCANLGSAGEGCRNSTGSGALLSAIGASGVAADDLQLIVWHAPGNAPALLFSGSAKQNGGIGNLFGDGLLCAGGQIQRHGAKLLSSAGVVSWGPGLAASNGWVAGDTRYFQGWFRDTSGPCGSGFNTTNGQQLTYVP